MTESSEANECETVYTLEHILKLTYREEWHHQKREQAPEQGVDDGERDGGQARQDGGGDGCNGTNKLAARLERFREVQPTHRERSRRVEPSGCWPTTSPRPQGDAVVEGSMM